MSILNHLVAVGTSGSTSYLDSDILTDIGTLISQITTWLSDNKYLSLFFTIALIGLAIGLFKGLRGILRH